MYDMRTCLHCKSALKPAVQVYLLHYTRNCCVVNFHLTVFNVTPCAFSLVSAFSITFGIVLCFVYFFAFYYDMNLASSQHLTFTRDFFHLLMSLCIFYISCFH